MAAAIGLVLVGGCSTNSAMRDTSADGAGTTESAAYQASATTEEKSERLICRRERPTGSRISETICLTAEDWQRIAEGSQATIRQAQRAPKSYNDQ
jgi:hypothetical protein